VTRRAERIVRMSRPSADPDCDYCRRNAHGNASRYRLSTHKLQLVVDGLWIYLCDEHTKEYSL